MRFGSCLCTLCGHELVVCMCAQLGDGSSLLWDGSYTNRNTPPSSDVLTGVAAITVGSDHTCALTTAGGVRCWGQNVHGQARHHLHTCVCLCVSVSVCLLRGGYEAYTRNRAQRMCAAVVNDDARLSWLIVCVLVCTLLVS
jgi:hypothetical protein